MSVQIQYTNYITYYILPPPPFTHFFSTERDNNNSIKETIMEYNTFLETQDQWELDIETSSCVYTTIYHHHRRILLLHYDDDNDDSYLASIVSSAYLDTTDALPCHINLPVCFWIKDPRSRAAEKNTSHRKGVPPQDTTHLIQRPCYQRGSLCQDPAGNRTARKPPDHRKVL